MSRLIPFFRSKLALALLGAVLCAGGAAFAAVGPFTMTANHAAPPQPQTYVGSSANGTGTPTPGTAAPGTTPTPAATSGVTPGATPSATPGRSPTATPTPRPPTPTPTPQAGQAGSLHGTVTNVNTSTNQFTVRTFTGTTTTVAVNAQTTFQGACTSLSGLRTGWSVAAQGIYQADGSLLATAVNSDN
jgi:hypothetical protein